MNEYPLKQAKAEVVERSLLRSAYLWMGFALFVTGVTAYLGTSLPIGSGSMLLLGIGTIVLSMVLQANIMRMSSAMALTAFTAYAVMMGLFLTPVFTVYLRSTVYTAFFVCAGTFAAMSVYGYVTKSNLQGMGHYLFMGLIGILLASLVNMLFRSSGLDLLLSYAGVALFTIMAAYDAQRIKLLGQQMAGSDDHTMTAMAILSALHLYLTFINLFLFMLRILGRRD